MKRSVAVFLFSFLSILLFAQAKIPYGNNKATGRYAALNGIRFYYETYGKGQPLLLLHGNGGSINAFEQNIPFLAQHFNVIVLDSRAQGKSVDFSDSISFEQMADDAVALLRYLKIDSAFVLGWSDGGIVGLCMAMRNPQAVRKLLTTGANLWPDSTAIAPWLWRQQKAVVDTIHTENFTAQRKNDWKLFLLDWLQPNIALSDLKKIKCPVLVMAGDRDVIRTEHTVLIAENIPDSYLWIVPNSGHATLMEHRDEFNAAALSFFSGGFKRR